MKNKDKGMQISIAITTLSIGAVIGFLLGTIIIPNSPYDDIFEGLHENGKSVKLRCNDETTQWAKIPECSDNTISYEKINYINLASKCIAKTTVFLDNDITGWGCVEHSEILAIEFSAIGCRDLLHKLHEQNRLNRDQN